jgi:hypothetical protein
MVDKTERNFTAQIPSELIDRMKNQMDRRNQLQKAVFYAVCQMWLSFPVELQSLLMSTDDRPSIVSAMIDGAMRRIMSRYLEDRSASMDPPAAMFEELATQFSGRASHRNGQSSVADKSDGPCT